MQEGPLKKARYKRILPSPGIGSTVHVRLKMNGTGERRPRENAKHWRLPAMKRIKASSVLLILAMVFSILTTLFPTAGFAAVPSSPGRSAAGAATTPERPLRNVAFRRAAWHSSAANYDNTGQLIADGIIGVLSDEVIDYSGTSASNPTYGQMIPGTVNSEWISASNGEEWVYLDFGAVTSLRSIKVYWGANYAIAYDIQISDDAKTWITAARAAGAAGSAVDTNLSSGIIHDTLRGREADKFAGGCPLIAEAGFCGSSARLPPGRITLSAKWKSWA